MGCEKIFKLLRGRSLLKILFVLSCLRKNQIVSHNCHVVSEQKKSDLLTK